MLHTAPTSPPGPDQWDALAGEPPLGESDQRDTPPGPVVPDLRDAPTAATDIPAWARPMGRPGWGAAAVGKTAATCISLAWTRSASLRAKVMSRPGKWCPLNVVLWPTPSGGASRAGAPRINMRGLSAPPRSTRSRKTWSTRLPSMPTSSSRRSTIPLMERSPRSATEEATESRPHSISAAIGHAGSEGVLPCETAWLMMCTNVASHVKENTAPPSSSVRSASPYTNVSHKKW